MVKRKTIKIDGSLCDGCASCIVACAEGAIELVDGKAMVVHHEFCDGLGACIGECPKGALTIVEREIKEFDESPRLPLCNATSSKQAHTASVREPGGFMQRLDQSLQLTSWPIQMRLANASASYFENARLLIAADCSAFACPSISDLIRRRVVLIGCPKLEDMRPFVIRLAEILNKNDIMDITIIHMEVPCCLKLVRLVMEAMEISDKKIPVSQYTCKIGGELARDEIERQ